MDIGSIQSLPAAAAVTAKSERASGTSDKAMVSVVERKPSETTSVEDVTALKNDASVSREDIEAAVASIQDFVQTVRRDLNFSLEEGSGRVVVKVTDAGSGDVIRQIPSEEALQLAENLSEVRSLLFKAEA